MFEYTGSRVAFSLFGIDVYWYGLLIVLGMLLATELSTREFKRQGGDPNLITDMVIWVLPISIIGARIWYVLFELDRYNSFMDMINIRDGGLAIHGGVIAGVIVGYIFLNRRGISFFKVSDIIATFIPLAQAIGRWGNFINNEAFGRETDVPWALIIDGKKYHPTFFYESLGNVIIFLIIYFYIRKKENNMGYATATYLIGYGIIRFFIEGLRTDSLWWGPIRVAQLVSVVFVLMGIIILILAKKEKLGNKNIIRR